MKRVLSMLALVLVVGCTYKKEVTITSEPSGGNITLDGVPAGVTPLKREIVFKDEQESISVAITKEGYDEQRTLLKYFPATQTKYHVIMSRATNTPGPGPAPAKKGSACGYCGEERIDQSAPCPHCGQK